jgi:hydrogenase maturation protein HypF
MEMEALAVRAALPVTDFYPFGFGSGELDFRETIRHITRDRSLPQLVAGRFHNTVAQAVATVCASIASATGIRRVCLSGGTFQNFHLTGLARELLLKSDLEVFLHSRVPPNDGGLCLGQAAIASYRLGNASASKSS